MLKRCNGRMDVVDGAIEILLSWDAATGCWKKSFF
jgi:hypothetical protein